MWCELEICWACASQTGSLSAVRKLYTGSATLKSSPSFSVQSGSVPVPSCCDHGKEVVHSTCGLFTSHWTLVCRGLRKRIEKTLDRERLLSGDLQAIWFSVYLGKGMQILIRLLGSVADVKVACKYPFSLPLASSIHLPHKGHPYLQRLQ